MENQIIRLDQAKALGLKFYFTGTPCKNGHVAPRYASTRQCSECIKQHSKKWDSENRSRRRKLKKAAYKANIEHYRKWKNNNYQKNKEKERKRAIDYYRNNIEKVMAYRAENAEAIKQRIKSWRLRNPDRYAAYSMCRRARRLEATPLWADVKLILAWYGLARVMSDTMSEKYEVDHVVPLRGRNVCGLHTQDNFQIITRSENARKSNKWPFESPMR
jgi:hypothetical protein